MLDAERDFYLHANSAVHRGAHTLAVEATDLFEDARITVANFVGATDEEIVWTSNATEALNLVAYSIGNASQGIGGPAAERFALGPGVKSSPPTIEHHANLIPWQILAQRTGATLRHIPSTEDGQLDYEAAEGIINEKTRIVAFTHVSNVTGAITDVPRMVALARKHGALVVLDACQSVPHMPVDFHALDVDFAASPATRCWHPAGIGALYGRAELLNALPPFLTGGSMITRVGLQDAEYMPAPIKFEAGTSASRRQSRSLLLCATCSTWVWRTLRRGNTNWAPAWLREFRRSMVCDVLGPTDPTKRAGLVALAIDGRAPARCGAAARYSGHRRARGPPLRPAVAPLCRRDCLDPCIHLHLQHHRRRGRFPEGAC